MYRFDRSLNSHPKKIISNRGENMVKKYLPIQYSNLSIQSKLDQRSDALTKLLAHIITLGNTKQYTMYTFLSAMTAYTNETSL